jgi:hypothetical protein
MAATTQREKMLATIDYQYQNGRHEEVVGLTDLMSTMLQRYADSHNGWCLFIYLFLLIYYYNL